MQGNSKAVANCENLKFSAFEFGKGHLQSNNVNTTKNNPMKEQDLNKDNIMPGKMVSKDHYILRAPGRLYHTKMKSDPYNMLSGGCVFIDHDSGYVSIKNQVDINATETFKEKITFEREDQSQGVMIKGYHTDNGIFKKSEFMEKLLKKQQKIRFSGAVASHQNWSAESTTKTVVTMARTTLMHWIMMDFSFVKLDRSVNSWKPQRWSIVMGCQHPPRPRHLLGQKRMVLRLRDI